MPRLFPAGVPVAGGPAVTERLGWLATVVFLDLDGRQPDLTDDAAFRLVMDVAAGATDVEEIANRLRVASR